jgi:excisionase family DNA binding protein
MPRNLTEAEAADRLGFKAETLRKWRAQGKGPAYLKLGRSIRYRLADVEAWELSGLVVPDGA